MGRPKAGLVLPDGRTMLEHAVGLAQSVGGGAQEVVILGQAVPLPPALADVRVLPDAAPQAGPLGGLCALLDYAGTRWGLLLACDLPLLTSRIIHQLFAAAHPDVDAVAFHNARTPGTWHACCALYHPRIRDFAIRALLDGDGSLNHLLGRVRLASLDAGPQEERQLLNVNRPEDLLRLMLKSSWV